MRYTNLLIFSVATVVVTLRATERTYFHGATPSAALGRIQGRSPSASADAGAPPVRRPAQSPRAEATADTDPGWMAEVPARIRDADHSFFADSGQSWAGSREQGRIARSDEAGADVVSGTDPQGTTITLRAAAGAGDVNGDGFDDLVLGDACSSSSSDPYGSMTVPYGVGSAPLSRRQLGTGAGGGFPRPGPSATSTP